MKTYTPWSLAVMAAGAMTLASCSSESVTTVDNQNVSESPRTNLKPGESNWAKPVAKSGGEIAAFGDITTQDLTMLGGAPQTLVNALVGTGTNAPTTSNVTFTGLPIALGSFTGGDDAIGFGSGIILASGNIATITGPNNYDDATTNMGQPGDAALDALVGGGTQDATVLEFDFECYNTTVISFQYVFASEEYNEYVNTNFNDVFAFIVNGVNVALIPTTATPVAINNLNCGNPYNPASVGTYCELFRNNDLSDGGGAINTEADGLTVILTAVANVNPGVNHIKIAIADRGDWAYDSWVMIKGESFVCGLQEINVGMDVKPGSCPNPVSSRDRGVVPVAILGSAEFDVSSIDLSTVQLLGLSPVKSSIADVAGPYADELTDCTSCSTALFDGNNDLVLHFDAQDLFAALGEVTHNECRVITISGETTDGTPIVGSDIIRIQSK